MRVLSVHTTVVEPSASTAGNRRTSAWRLAMRRSPTASAIVATAGSASGTAATASAIPISITSASGAPWTAPRAATSAATPRASQTSRRPSASRRRSSGVRFSSIPPTRAPIRPSSVAGPVAVTTASAVPPDTVVPLYAMVDRSASGVSAGRSRSPRFETGRDSPVSAASSVRRSVASTRRTSAGTRCPASRRTRSPGTSVAASTVCRCPSRVTTARLTSNCSSASIARRARHSVANPMSVLMASTAPIASVSARSPSASDTAAAATSNSTTTLFS